MASTLLVSSPGLVLDVGSLDYSPTDKAPAKSFSLHSYPVQIYFPINANT